MSELIKKKKEIPTNLNDARVEEVKVVRNFILFFRIRNEIYNLRRS